MGPEVAMVKSSAYEEVRGAVWGKSETKKLKRTGEMTEPWGTPACTLRGEDLWLRKRQEDERPRRYVVNQRVALSGRWEWLIMLRRRLWLTESNAFDMSMAVAMVRLGGLRWLKPSAILVTRGRRAVMVERRGRNPCWDSHGCKKALRVGRMRRSRILATWLRREIGRYDELVSLGLPGLSMGMIFDCFQMAGMSALLSERLKRAVR